MYQFIPLVAIKWRSTVLMRIGSFAAALINLFQTSVIKTLAFDVTVFFLFHKAFFRTCLELLEMCFWLLCFQGCHRHVWIHDGDRYRENAWKAGNIRRRYDCWDCYNSAYCRTYHMNEICQSPVWWGHSCINCLNVDTRTIHYYRESITRLILAVHH